jgi:hypothetical protein
LIRPCRAPGLVILVEVKAAFMAQSLISEIAKVNMFLMLNDNNLPLYNFSWKGFCPGESWILRVFGRGFQNSFCKSHPQMS